MIAEVKHVSIKHSSETIADVEIINHKELRVTFKNGNYEDLGLIDYISISNKLINGFSCIPYAHPEERVVVMINSEPAGWFQFKEINEFKSFYL